MQYIYRAQYKVSLKGTVLDDTLHIHWHKQIFIHQQHDISSGIGGVRRKEWRRSRRERKRRRRLKSLGSTERHKGGDRDVLTELMRTVLGTLGCPKIPNTYFECVLETPERKTGCDWTPCGS